MEPTIFRFIFRHSKKEQIFLLVLTGLSFPFLYYSLDLPKTIINEAIGGKQFPAEVFGYQLDQIPYLLLLSGIFLALVCVNGGFKYYINVYRGQLGERMLRRLRYDLYARVLRFPLPHFRRVSQGEVIPMITAEVEPLGGFIGDAISLPAFQGGTLLTILVFMFVQDPILGTAAIALYPIQGYIIPKLQRRVNALGKERVKAVRKLSDRIGESISGVQEIHANDSSRFALAGFTSRLGEIYTIRYEIYRRKFFIKFLNNFIAQLTPFFFYSIGGVLVIQGDLTFGALVAILAAYKDLSAPWKELLTYYQRKEDSRIKYEQVIEQFDPAGSLTEAQQIGEPETPVSLDGPVAFRNVGLTDDEGEVLLDGISFEVTKGDHVAITGPGGGGKDLLAMVAARLLPPTSGSVTMNGVDIAPLPESVTGRRIGYVGPVAFVFSNTIRQNLLMGAQHAPSGDPDPDFFPDSPSQRADAEASGNSLDPLSANWVDYEAIGTDEAGLKDRIAQLLKVVGLEDEVYAFGLRGSLSAESRDEIGDRILGARTQLRSRLEELGLASLVEAFDEEKFNTNASVAENLLFGTPVGDAFALDHLASDPYVRSLLDKVGLTEDFVRIGREVASTMVELFKDLPPDHEFFAQYSFISADDLPDFQLLLQRADRLGLDGMETEDRDRFLDLPFKLIPARHRLGMISDELQSRILEARKLFREELPEDRKPDLEFFSVDQFNLAASVQDNILFGKIAYGQADAGNQVGKVLAEVIESEGLRATVIEVGLDAEAGIAGSRLTTAQRQKVAMARMLLRRPDVIVLNEAVAALDSGMQAPTLARVCEEAAGRTVIFVAHRARLAQPFGRVLVMRGGRVIEDGSFDSLNEEGTAFRALLDEE
ncbi:ABC transporter transmembrane domain-containing protein [Nisaea acidiphila]|uniref:ABC transporter transmembrane domain-containing protein n=1 Tax=Nisaea acidiphila TaxID=1862145 RepID=A0A9J7ALG9_9PROT|nr:ABC transporter transmembrane domain-containing protein [Nisaea acidiphila]UUX48006.1 ABC transporter transmembrane domain-containing protein [Nisaea acidiphila]